MAVPTLYELVAVIEVGVNVFGVVAPLYISFTTNVAFANVSICEPVDLAVTVWLLFPITNCNTGAAFLTFEYVISFDALITVPPPS